MRLVYFFSLFLLSCVGSDTSWLPESIDEAKNQNLLIHIYRPTQTKVNVDGTDFILENGFTAFKNISKNDNRKNENFFAFIIKSKNAETGKGIESIGGNPYDYINFHSKDGGIHESQLGITYDDISIRDKLDSIQIGFLDSKKVEHVVYFVKQ